MSELSRETELEVLALADGSLEPDRRPQILERIQGSPQLSAELEHQQRALSMLHAAEVKAPESLHNLIESLVSAEQQSTRSRRRRASSFSWPALAGAGAAIAVAGAAMAVIFGGGSSTPSLSQTFALTLRPATTAAPAESHTDKANVTASVEGLSFPYWKERFGWRTTGARTDRIAGHNVTTVFYANDKGQRVGYAILARPALSASGGTLVTHRGINYRVLNNAGVPVVTWTRNGHLCVISGRDVSAHMLLKLASWSDLKPTSAGEST